MKATNEIHNESQMLKPPLVFLASIQRFETHLKHSLRVQAWSRAYDLVAGLRPGSRPRSGGVGRGAEPEESVAGPA